VVLLVRAESLRIATARERPLWTHEYQCFAPANARGAPGPTTTRNPPPLHKCARSGTGRDIDGTLFKSPCVSEMVSQRTNPRLSVPDIRIIDSED
jgi:hypothetical protein